MMRVTMLLADAAQAVGGKLYILGGGWSITSSPSPPMAIAIKIEVDWHDANTAHQLRLALLDEDGQPVMVPTPTGDRPCEVNSTFEVGRPAGLRQGTPLDVPLAINVSPLPLQPGCRYVWQCFINGDTEENWKVGFSTRPASTPAQPA